MDTLVQGWHCRKQQLSHLALVHAHTICVHVYIHIYMYSNVCAYAYVYICICTYVQIHVYACPVCVSIESLLYLCRKIMRFAFQDESNVNSQASAAPACFMMASHSARGLALIVRSASVSTGAGPYRQEEYPAPTWPYAPKVSVNGSKSVGAHS